MHHLLDEVVSAQKRGESHGIPSICSAHPWVLKAALQGSATVLIESTCNQVNQFGGYTGLDPQAFAAYISKLAQTKGFDAEKLILGGDHLGPSPWQKEPQAGAMQKADGLVQACVQAGYTKIHLDASMRLGDDDPKQPLEVELIARRTARLAKVAESSCLDPGQEHSLRYVIGSEVPIPGGATEHEEGVSVTRVEAVRQMLGVMQKAFMREGLERAWERVIALVVQPGVEFGDGFVLNYDRDAAGELSRYIEATPFIYEAHSTDYQPEESLREMVRDHFAILKVGPALTYAFREAAFALAALEGELVPGEERSHLVERLDEAMLSNPVYWQGHYHGSQEEVTQARRYSRSDRIRYYWAEPGVQAALEKMLSNLGNKPLPAELLSQYLPRQVAPTGTGQLGNSAGEILLESVRSVLRGYYRACEPGNR